MKLLFVIHNYGDAIAGGSERYCRELATRLLDRGHDVEVLTSRARGTFGWPNDHPPGTTRIDGVTVHRLSSTDAGSPRFAGPISGAVRGVRRAPYHVQREYLRLVGPYLPDLPAWLQARGAGFDAAVFFNFFLHTTTSGLPVAAPIVPTVLHPMAHDMGDLHLPVFDAVFRSAGALVYLSPEEAELVDGVFHLRSASRILPMGVEPAPDDGGESFRHFCELHDTPYVLCIGRSDTGKGVHQLAEYFAAYRRRNPAPLKLAFIGDAGPSNAEHPDIVCAGFVDEAMKRSAIAGAALLVQPSFYESYSIVLTEAWALGRPVLVNGLCAATRGHVLRAGGGLVYTTFAEFETALDWLRTDGGLARALADSGRRYVERVCDWGRILSDYEQFLEDVVARGVLTVSST